MPVLESRVCFSPMEPAIENKVVLAWRKGAKQSRTVQRFIQFARCFLGME